MALLGSGFKVTEPSDDDLVKYGASWMRDIKNRLKAFVSVLFNPDTGQLLDNIITYQKLKSLSPDPTGVFNWGTVNEKGLVTAGQDVSMPDRGRHITEIFIGAIQPESVSSPVTPSSSALRFDPDSGQFYEEANDDWVQTNTDFWGQGEPNHWSARKLWTVPSGVTQVRVTAAGGGGGGSLHATTPKGGAGACWAMANFIVTPQQQYELWIGSGGEGADTADGHDGTLTRFYLDNTTVMAVKGGNGAKSGSAGTVPWPINVFGTGHTTQYIGIRAAGIPGDPTGPNGGACGNGIQGGVDNNYVATQYGAGGAGGTVAGLPGGPGFIILDYIY